MARSCRYWRRIGVVAALLLAATHDPRGAIASTTTALLDSIDRISSVQADVTLVGNGADQAQNGAAIEKSSSSISENRFAVGGRFDWLFLGAEDVSSVAKVQTNATRRTDRIGSTSYYGSGEKKFLEQSSVIFSVVRTDDSRRFFAADDVNAQEHNRKIKDSLGDRFSVFVWLSWFGAGYARGNGELKLNVADTAATVAESYHYGVDTIVLSMRSLTTDRTGFRATYAMTTLGANGGTSANKKQGTEQLLTAEWAWNTANSGLAALRATHLESAEEFAPLVKDQRTRDQYTFGWTPTKDIELAISLVTDQDKQGFAIGAKGYSLEHRFNTTTIGVKYLFGGGDAATAGPGTGSAIPIAAPTL